MSCVFVLILFYTFSAPLYNSLS